MGSTTTDTGLSTHLASRRVVFFGGKGGVGKTTVASATAAALAAAGRRVLVVSTDPAHNLGHLWDTEVGDTETDLLTAEGGGAVVGVEVDPDAVAARHLDAVKDTVRGLMPAHLHQEVDRYFRLAAASPGTHEAALLERLSRIALEAQERFDAVLFDTAPTGHTTRLLELPTLMGAWADGLLERRDRTERYADAMRGLDGRRGLEGPRTAQERRDLRIREVLTARRRIFADMEALLTDPDRCAFVPVLTAERMAGDRAAVPPPGRGPDRRGGPGGQPALARGRGRGARRAVGVRGGAHGGSGAPGAARARGAGAVGGRRAHRPGGRDGDRTAAGLRGEPGQRRRSSTSVSVCAVCGNMSNTRTRSARYEGIRARSCARVRGLQLE